MQEELLGTQELFVLPVCLLFLCLLSVIFHQGGLIIAVQTPSCYSKDASALCHSFFITLALALYTTHS